MDERINPIRITLKDTGETYELDFNRDSVEFAERHDFKLEDVPDYVATKVPEFFYYAFRWHHKRLSRGQTDAILKRIGGLTPKMLNRMMELYQQAAIANNVQDDEDLEKNSQVAVEF